MSGSMNDPRSTMQLNHSMHVHCPRHMISEGQPRPLHDVSYKTRTGKMGGD